MTTQTSPPQSADRIDRAIGYSIAFHLILFAIFAVRAYMGPSEMILQPPTIHVDMVGLPDHVPAKKVPVAAPAPEPPKEKVPPAEKPAPPKPEPKPAPVEVKPETPKVNLNKTKRDEQAALRRLEALARLQNAPAPKTESKEAPQQPAQAAPPVRGNVMSAGSSLTGISRLENEKYTETVHNHVTQHWALPGFLSTANLSARVRVFIDDQGNLMKKQLLKSSGNPVFDQSAMDAVEHSLPLPRPPSDLVNLVSVRGIDIDFTPEH